jgi:hypothetical protein
LSWLQRPLSGTPSHLSKRVEAVTQLLEQAKKQAFFRLAVEEVRILEQGGKVYAAEGAAEIGLKNVKFSS